MNKLLIPGRRTKRKRRRMSLVVYILCTRNPPPRANFHCAANVTQIRFPGRDRELDTPSLCNGWPRRYREQQGTLSAPLMTPQAAISPDFILVSIGTPADTPICTHNFCDDPLRAALHKSIETARTIVARKPRITASRQ